MRQVQGIPYVAMSLPARRLYPSPPKPDPAVAMPMARLRWMENQGPTTERVCHHTVSDGDLDRALRKLTGMYTIPIPNP